MINRVQIDLHGYEVLPAKQYLISYLKQLKQGEYELCVIHGYRSTKLLEMVRAFKYPCVIRKIRTLNPGETILYIKK